MPNVAPCDISSLNVQINIIEVAVPEVEDANFCVLEGRRLQDINISDNGLLVNYYESLLSDNPITNNPLLVNGDVYYISLEDASACESERVAVNVIISNVGGENCPLEFQDGVSPNGDGKNDTFALNWINENYDIPVVFPDYILEIYNRYGVIVYEANADTDEFDGNNNVSLSLGKDLPSGTYFYIFKPNFLNNPPIQGSFYLSK